LLGIRCERARALGSARLDGPLSEFDRADLDRHLGECPECRHVVAGMGEFTHRVRSAPAQWAPRWAGAVTVARRPARRRGAGMVAGVAAAAAVAAGVGALVASPWHRPPPAHNGPTPFNIAERHHAPFFNTGISGPQLRSGRR
jgi:predicted anti-sigma-YlaC factor YlaD